MIRILLQGGPHDGSPGHYVGPTPETLFASDLRDGRVDLAEDPAGYYAPGELPHRYRLTQTTRTGIHVYTYDPEEGQ